MTTAEMDSKLADDANLLLRIIRAGTSPIPAVKNAIETVEKLDVSSKYPGYIKLTCCVLFV